MTDIFQTLVLLATFDVALIAVAIANYAVSASYLGRETRLSRSRMERRKTKLQSDLSELKNTKLEISEVKEKISKAESDITSLNSRIFFLSWQGAVIIPTAFFATSFILALIGMNIDAPLNFQLMIVSGITVTIGFLEIMAVIRFIDLAAKNIPTPDFSVYFGNRKQSITLNASKMASITLSVENIGEEMGEDVWIYRNFPDGFTVKQGIGCKFAKYDENGAYPNHSTLNDTMSKFHPNIVHNTAIGLMTPSKTGTYDIVVNIYERKVGKVKKILNIEVVP